jgi:hypothetical protein
MTGAEVLLVSIPGHGSFTVTAEAAAMIDVFGGLLHCYQGSGGCRKQGLYFSRTEPKKPLRCLLELPAPVKPAPVGRKTPADGTGSAKRKSSSASATNWHRNWAVQFWTSETTTRCSVLFG